jgi:hypothetical protein
MPHARRIIGLAAFLCLAYQAAPAFAQTPLSYAQAMDFLVQKVCVDAGGHALPIDPYDCTAGDTLRSLRAGEPLPYHKHDQPDASHPEGLQRHDSYPLRDIEGHEVVANPFDYGPSFDHYKPWGDGYDIYLVRDGWASASKTQDGGGFSTTFYGSGCTPYNGWVFFDLASLRPSGIVDGSAYVPITGRYWEHNGEPSPGACPSSYSKDTLTTWEWIKEFPFGGIGGNPIKTLDAIRVVHGLQQTAAFAAQGHLEVFYFTKLYGITRWEVWVADQGIDSPDSALQKSIARAAQVCGGSPHVVYQGQNFTRTACRDWSAVTPARAPEPPTPWPIPDMNLLLNFHFGSDLENWIWTGSSADGSQINPALKNSLAPRDASFVQRNGKGVRYLAVNCSGPCAPDEYLYQDVPVSSLTSSGMYTFGVVARSEGSPGTLQIELQQIDGGGNALDTKAFDAAVDPRNQRFSGDDSVLLSSGFFSTTTSLTIDSRTRALRFIVSPKTRQIFDILDAWLMKDTY